MDEERRILYYLDPFFTNLKEKIILSIFFQYNSLSYDNLFEKLNQKISINRYDIEFFLLKLISEGWISSDSSNNSFKKNDLFKLGPNLAIKSQLEALIEQTNDKLIHQKQKFYGISQLLKFKENGKSLSKSLEMLELSAMPDSYPIILKDHIYFLQQTLPNSIFKFEKNNLISFPLKNISFRLYSVEIGYLEDKEMKYGGIFLNQMVDGINRDEIIQQIHQYHRNNLHIKYKLEIGGYYEKNT